MATVSLIIFIDRAFVGKVSSIIYSDIVRISWVAYSYFEGLIFLLFNILILLIIVLNVVGVFSTMVIFIYALGSFILRWVVPFLRFNVDDRYISRNVTDVYYLNFLIRVILI